jgi:exonuclease III
MADTQAKQVDTRISIKHINAQSIKNKISLLELEAEEYDVVTISETWLHDSIENRDLHIEGFNEPLRCDRPGDRYGGVAIYHRAELPVKERKDIYTPGVEALWIDIQVQGKKILIETVYRPPNERAEYWDLLAENLEKAKETEVGTIILTGDLNCNMLVPDTKLHKILAGLHMELLIKKPTHYTGNNATLLDIIATTSTDLVERSEVLTPTLSNHCDVAVHLNVRKPETEIITLYTPDPCEKILTIKAS